MQVTKKLVDPQSWHSDTRFCVAALLETSVYKIDIPRILKIWLVVGNKFLLRVNTLSIIVMRNSKKLEIVRYFL